MKLFCISSKLEENILIDHDRLNTLYNLSLTVNFHLNLSSIYDVEKGT